MRRSLVLVLGWLAATLVAVGISWAGVRLVAAQVVEPLPVAIDEVTEDPSPVASPSPSPSPSASPTSSPSAPGGEAGDDDGSSSPGPSVTTAPDQAPHDAPNTSETSGSDDGSEDPGEDDDPPAAADPTETRTYSLVGGTVTVEFSSTSVRVIQATPADGFTREVDQEGATQVEVEFRSDDHRSRLEAWWDGGPRSDIDEDVEGSGSDESDDSHDSDH